MPPPNRKKPRLIQGQAKLFFRSEPVPSEKAASLQAEVQEHLNSSQIPRAQQDLSSDLGNKERENIPESDQGSQETDPLATPTQNKTLDTGKGFKENWKRIYAWLEFDPKKNLMYCKLCKDAGKQNTMGLGCSNFRTSTLSRHVKLDEHLLLVNAPTERQNAKVLMKKALSKDEQAIEVAMMTVFWLCQENIALRKYSSLMKFLKLLKVPNLEHLNCTQSIDYSSPVSANGFLEILSSIIDANIVSKVRSSPVVTILTDESTDIVVHHKLAINLRIVDPLTLKPSTHFLTDVRLHDGKGASLFMAIESELKKRDIPLTKVYGLGTDGAAVMTGRKTGLTGQFLKINAHIANTHCSAHRVALVSEQAADGIKSIKEFKETITSIYYYFYKSPTKTSQLEEIQKVLEDPVLKYREVHQIRWLSFFKALEAVYRTLDSLLSFFMTQGEAGNPKAVGLKKKIGQAMFIKLTYGMMDWLQPIMKLSLFFQRKDLDISLVKVNVDGCIKDLTALLPDGTPTSDQPTYLSQVEADLVTDGVTTFKTNHNITANDQHFPSVQKKFIKAMIDNLKSRFPDTEIMQQFSVLGLRPINFLSGEDLIQWGNQEIRELANLYCNEQKHASEGKVFTSPPLIEESPEQVLREWGHCKDIVKACKYPVASLENLWAILVSYHGSDLRSLQQLVFLALTHPVHTADCERAFSAQNHTVTALRNRMSSQTCEQIMRIIIEGGNVEDFDFGEAVQKWRREKERKIFLKS